MLTDYFDIVIPRYATIESFTTLEKAILVVKLEVLILIEMPLISLIVQTCLKLISINLISHNIDAYGVIAIAQQCPKLETLVLAHKQHNMDS